MSILGILQAGNSGLTASQTVLRTISTNIANVNTPGYTRERVSLEAWADGSTLGGVKVSSIDRIVDRYLEQSARSALGDSAYQSVLSDFHGRLQSYLGRPDGTNTLAAQTDSVFASLQELSNAPLDSVRRRDAVAKMDGLLSGAAALADEIQGLRTQASNQLDSALTSINDLIATIDSLNDTIVEQTVTGRSVSALSGQRDQAISKLAELIDVEAREQSDGSMLLSTRSGLVLLDKSMRRVFSQAPGIVTPGSVFPAIDVKTISGANEVLTATGLTLDGNSMGGKVRGLLDLRDRDLPATAEALGQFVRSMAEEFNRIHNQSSAVPPPASLTGRNTGLLAGDAAHFSGRIVIAVTDSNTQVARKITVDLSTKATLNDILTDINSQLGSFGSASLSGGRLTLTAGSGYQGIIVADDPAAPSARAGRSFSQTFGLNDLITGQQPTSYRTGVQAADAHGVTAGTIKINLRDANNRLLVADTITPAPGGTFNDVLASLNDAAGLGRFATFALGSDGQLSVTPKPGVRGMTLDVEADNTQRGATGVGLAGFFGLGKGNTALAASLLKIRPDIKSDPQGLALARFDTGTAIGATALGNGDDRGAHALRDAVTATLGFSPAGSLPGMNTSLSGYISSLIADVSNRSNQASRAAEDALALSNAVVRQRDDYQGVNLDEELGNLVIYQNSYNASARLITTAREMYDTLLQLVQ